MLDLMDKTAANVEGKENIFETIIRLGLDCTKDKYEERPNMVEVLKSFEKTLGFTP